MITDEELIKRIDLAITEYHGPIDDFYSAVGMVVVGRLMGRRAMRVMCQRRHWLVASKLFGDLNELMPIKGKHYDRSVVMVFIDKMGGYWDYIKGRKVDLALSDRKMII
jgi:hypothetical protein